MGKTAEEKINKLGFGFLRLPKAEGSYDFTTVNEMVDRFMEQGTRYFDTCYTYLDGNSERGIKECVVKRYPRESFLLADKLPGYFCKTYRDCRKYFEIEKERCGVSYFDVYMLHWLNREHYEIAKRLRQFDFLQELKDKKEAVKIGFSYHDDATLLDEILSEHPEVDVVQIQLNYLDWESKGVQARACYEVCEKHGKDVYVMEPVKGGTLVDLPPEAEQILAHCHPEWSTAKWALAFAQSLPCVKIVLSGMNTVQQMEENLQPMSLLNETELDSLRQATEIINTSTAIPCTACEYCKSHCKKKIPIPDYFKMYNEYMRYPKESWKIAPAYISTAKVYAKASGCAACGICKEHCPQHIDIPLELKKVAAAFE